MEYSSCHGLLPSDSHPASQDSQFTENLLASALAIPGQGATGLLGLPNEVLLLIFEHLDGELYNIALLSRRLHHLALPIYLARNGMSPFSGELVLFDDRSKEVLQGLSIALFRPALKRVHATFNFCRTKEDVLKDARSLARLVSRLSRLDEAHLDFSYIVGVQAPPQHMFYPRWYSGLDWAKEFHALFDAIVKGTSCGKLTICLGGSGWFVPSTLSDLSAVFAKKRRSYDWNSFSQGVITTPFTNLIRYAGGNMTSSIIPSISPQRVVLESFYLHSSMLLHALFCSWTFNLLNNSGLSTLSLKNLNILPEAWAIILPRIAIPSLATLSIDFCSIGNMELAAFLIRHPQIRHLYLGRSSLLPVEKLRLPRNALCQLVHLSAAPEVLIHLLVPACSLPSLKTVSIMLRIPHGHRFNFGIINHQLLPISRRLQQVSLSLNLSLESNHDDWILASLTPDNTPDATIPHVSTLEIRFAMYRLPESTVANIPRWLALFPGLKQVSFFTLSQHGPTELHDRAIFIRSISRRCPKIEIIGINHAVHDVEMWLNS